MKQITITLTIEEAAMAEVSILQRANDCEDNAMAKRYRDLASKFLLKNQPDWLSPENRKALAS